MPKNDSANHGGRPASRLSVPLDVRGACRQAVVESGEIPMSMLPRCREIAPADGVASCEVRFFEGQGVHPLQADIHVTAPLALECARCLEPMTQTVSVASRLTFVFSDEQAEHVEADTEPVVLGREGRVRLTDLVEDEILMAVPVMPVHEAPCAEVGPGRPWESGQIEEPSAEDEKDNPFAALAALKRNGGGKE